MIFEGHEHLENPEVVASPKRLRDQTTGVGLEHQTGEKDREELKLSEQLDDIEYLLRAIHEDVMQTPQLPPDYGSINGRCVVERPEKVPMIRKGVLLVRRDRRARRLPSSRVT